MGGASGHRANVVAGRFLRQRELLNDFHLGNVCMRVCTRTHIYEKEKSKLSVSLAVVT